MGPKGDGKCQWAGTVNNQPINQPKSLKAQPSKSSTAIPALYMSTFDMDVQCGEHSQ